ncbi:MAG: hypothetical protein HON94_15600 [Methylococcales bacterium]|jgi:hypothetical protein|nr:hypothetical protein [Methylococcales bacterium]MBT7410336.1 hypothetical protein [Methylococcales bacterium]
MTDIETKIEPYHQIIGKINQDEKEQCALKLDIAKTLLTHAKSKTFADDVTRCFMQHLESPDTLTYSNLFTVIGKVR